MEPTLSQTSIKPSLIERALHWRYATKVFDKHKTIPDEQLELLLESLRLSPSSMGLQPWKFIVVQNKALRSELYEHSIQQSQLIDASHLLLLCSLRDINKDYIDQLITLEKQNNDHSMLEPFKAFAVSFLENRSKEDIADWMAQQVYIPLGFLLLTCALLHIDACPIEAFDHEKADDALNLAKIGLKTNVAVAVGYRSSLDSHANDTKTRWSKEEVIIHL